MRANRPDRPASGNEASEMKQVILLIMITALAGCGGVHKAKRAGSKPVVRAPVVSTPTNPVTTGVSTVPAAPVAKPFASGPIQKACISSDRKARSRELCGCIQAVANQTLSGAQQGVAVSFYADPHKAQKIRQSDRPAHEDFWQAYKTYGETAKRICG